MKYIMLCFLISITCLFPKNVMGHNGHGVFEGHQLAHHVTSPLHFLPILLGLTAIIYWYHWKTKLRKNDA